MLNRLIEKARKADKSKPAVDWNSFVEESIAADLARQKAFGIEQPKPKRTWIQRKVTDPVGGAFRTFASVAVVVVLASAAIVWSVTQVTGESFAARPQQVRPSTHYTPSTVSTEPQAKLPRPVAQQKIRVSVIPDDGKVHVKGHYREGKWIEAYSREKPSR